MKLAEITDREAWDKWVNASSFGHPLQLWGWGETKRASGWTPVRLALIDGETWVAAAQVLTWPIPKIGRPIAYIPRGPVGDPKDHGTRQLIAEIVKWARWEKAIYLRIEPAWQASSLGRGWKRARNSLQKHETFTIDLRKSEDEILEQMSHKHRQYIRKSERDGVSVVRAEPQDDMAAMIDIYQQTAKRAGFGIHSNDYYASLYLELGEHSYLYYAMYEGKPVAFLWLAAAGKTAYELYGGVVPAGADMKANYCLKWQAIRDMKTAGFEIYDFNGRLNEGVSRFKEGFGPDETDYVGTYDFPINLIAYHVWENLWPLAKPIGRRLGSMARGVKK
jgi:peptidoglycan pentaglycine glycine transferase (the first glycine)